MPAEMAKLYFKYGAMGSSKTAQALITKFNYEERGMDVWLLKPSVDCRDGETLLRSRIGLEATADDRVENGHRITEARSRIGLCAPADAIGEDDDLIELFAAREGRIPTDVIICDECQFLTGRQVEQLKYIVDHFDLPVLCFGLRTDFLTHLFPGSRRLFELADSITEIKTICECGSKATVNARIDGEGHVVTEGAQVFLGGNDSYIAMCHACWRRRIARERAERTQKEKQ